MEESHETQNETILIDAHHLTITITTEYLISIGGKQQW